MVGFFLLLLFNFSEHHQKLPTKSFIFLSPWMHLHMHLWPVRWCILLSSYSIVYSVSCTLIFLLTNPFNWSLTQKSTIPKNELYFCFSIFFFLSPGHKMPLVNGKNYFRLWLKPMYFRRTWFLGVIYRPHVNRQCFTVEILIRFTYSTQE